MSQLIKKNNKSTLKNRYSFATTDEMKVDLDQLKRVLQIDVNEHFRKFSEELIAKAKKLSA